MKRPLFVFTAAVAAVLARSSASRAEDLLVAPGQRPPLTVEAGQECHIADATPLLDANRKKKKRKNEGDGYRLRQLSEKPLILEETLKDETREGPFKLRIVQRGCEDVYARFEFTFDADPQDKGTLAPGRALQRAAEGLKILRADPDSLLSDKTLREIAGALAAKSQSDWDQSPVKSFRSVVACFSRLARECATDVGVIFDYPTLKVVYVDRP